MKHLARFAALAVVVACAPPPQAPTSPSSSSGELRYEVAIEEDDAANLELAVTASFPAQTSAELSVTEGGEPFVRDVAVAPSAGESWEKIEKKEGSWFATDCAKGCRVRYRLSLGRAAQEIDEDSVAMISHDVVEAPPPTWLLHPLEMSATTRVQFHVVSHVKDVSMATGVRRAHEADTYEISGGDLRVAPYTVFGRLRTQSIDAGGGAHIQFAIGSRSKFPSGRPGKMNASDAALAQWIERSAHAVTAFYGRFPIDGTLLVVLPSHGDEVGFGRTMAGGGASIMINVGRSADEATLAGDWVSVHEMIHLAFPSMGREHAWIEEGLATYLEPIVRARAGMTDEKNVWFEFLTMIQNGLPQPGDRGLDRTRTWGRTYWGGALFCLLADLRIRERTKNAFALDDALRGILRAGGDDNARWTMERAFDEGDKATGVPVLRELYAKMAFAPLPVNLDAIWQKLGVSVRGRDVLFDDNAPMADVRRSMTAERRLSALP